MDVKRRTHPSAASKKLISISKIDITSVLKAEKNSNNGPKEDK